MISGVYEDIRRGRVHLRVAPEARVWALTMLEKYGTLYEAGGQESRPPQGDPLVGRGIIHLVESPEDAGGSQELWAIRHAYRGGLLATLLGDRYLRTPATYRPFREWEASLGLAALGFSTPPLQAVAVYPSGLIYRADVVTRFIPFGRELPKALSSLASQPALQQKLLERVGGLIAVMGHKGVFHPDLNGKNLLVTGQAPHWELHLLDLDRTRLRGRRLMDGGRRMLRRLLRSLEKLGILATEADGSPARDALEQGFRDGARKPKTPFPSQG
ncbi:MAG: lipopolysaccharide kinase InaA family protein [Gemmatimonadota bacterium]